MCSFIFEMYITGLNKDLVLLNLLCAILEIFLYKTLKGLQTN